MSNNKPEICAEEIRVAPNPNSNVIRTPLSAFGRYQLEKQFNQQVPEYRNVGNLKHNVMLGSYALSAVSAVGLAIGATQRYVSQIILCLFFHVYVNEQESID